MQKIYYSISEISKIIDEEQYILRYWEKEFDALKPRKNNAGNRMYSKKDVFILTQIKKLIRDEKLSVKGAKERIAEIVSQPDFEKNIILVLDETKLQKAAPQMPLSIFGNESTKNANNLNLNEIISELKEIKLILNN